MTIGEADIGLRKLNQTVCAKNILRKNKRLRAGAARFREQKIYKLIENGHIILEFVKVIVSNFVKLYEN